MPHNILRWRDRAIFLSDPNGLHVATVQPSCVDDAKRFAGAEEMYDALEQVCEGASHYSAGPDPEQHDEASFYAGWVAAEAHMKQIALKALAAVGENEIEDRP